ncbi:hypothetical protein CDV36_004296 [Fusarium kuroshium]|uniref:Dipeptidylpeptidase IV N-terminal domain-containing protein n=1 Tax=Fusarium kuroshium TaxID=2010991 RepID=A0A3M2SFI9_9HYPO|nr:hypothetical protein CDV36_004296 [Fusarium kuroshium]
MEAPRWFVEHSTVKDEPSSQLQFSNGKLAVLWSQGGCPHLTYYDVTSGAQTTSLELPSSGDEEEYFHGFSVSPSGRRAAWRSSGICERRDIFISQGEGGIQSVSVDVSMDAWYDPRLSFLDDSTVLTDRGMLDIDAFLAEAPIEPNALHKFVEDIPTPHPEFTGYGCSDDRDWITLDGDNLIWLPVQYRPKSLGTRFAAGERHFATHCSSGILCMNFSEDARDLF